MDIKEKRPGRRSGLSLVLSIIFALLTLATAIAIIIGGGKLISLGGSAYYLIAGIAYIVLVALYFKKPSAGFWFSCAIFLLTIIWALAEVGGLNYWDLLPRLVVPALLFLLSLLVTATDKGLLQKRRRLSGGLSLVVFVALLATLVGGFFPHNTIYNPEAISTDPLKQSDANASKADQDWRYISRNASGTRFAPFDQVNADNVKDLQVAWTYHTGRRLTGNAAGVDENTPIQIGSSLYTCTPENKIAAVDADTGKPIWTFDPHAHTYEHVTCRSVGYYDYDRDDTLTADQKAAYTDTSCRQRIIVTTVDARLIALDAHTGEMCQNFGQKGTVDLQLGLGDTANSRRYHPTSVPLIMGHLTVFGAWIRDVTEDEPSGALRAYDVRDGSLVWAWDVGNTEGAKQGSDHYTLSTPNVWAIPTFDKDLGQLYVSTGNGPTDYWGGDRNKAKETFGSSVIALDVNTGKTKWVYQTVHHDIWDYDLPSQPVMYNMKNEQGEVVPALIQTTKMGEFFVLDRRTGKPVSKVEERPVPTSPAAKDEHLSPTQPFSVDMPTIGLEHLNERKMWGVSMFDQLYCRILFKSALYSGIFQPNSEQTYLEFPATMGGMNWGGVSIDETSGILYVNDIRMGMLMSMKTKEQAKGQTVSLNEVPQWAGTIRPQIGGPYVGTRMDNFSSFLQVPCQHPPFGTMTAIDLNSKKIVWQVPMGTVEDTGPLGIKTHMAMPVGMPTLGGPTSTKSGLVFFAGTQDNYLRALDSKTGKEVWKARLPVGATASPLIYQSAKSGKEYIVISAGGAAHSPDVGDYLIAYALPDKA
ncbi:membrane-bound PQQ-dependent dehydrogenase, glucose/quinate/shikimate family [Erwinia typographi]|uniref:membrane-bound PQQ-dependent dehydrogenase, glucose/quinate/shikimate family n=1 Tax=Erwinia typographi TaxID=371042 RepID=UPI00068F1795|nr:membrane-bound PQQ-dependent dehydrogenase, glucose/quinate/shikimate family [Erwinia typographi]